MQPGWRFLLVGWIIIATCSAAGYHAAAALGYRRGVTHGEQALQARVVQRVHDEVTQSVRAFMDAGHPVHLAPVHFQAGSTLSHAVVFVLDGPAVVFEGEHNTVSQCHLAVFGHDPVVEFRNASGTRRTDGQ